MSKMSDYLEAQLASHIFGSGTFTKPTVLAIALTKVPPQDSWTGTLGSEEIANAGSYARQTLNPSETNWLDPIGTDGETHNMDTLEFPEATTDWGWVSGVAVCTSATYGAGQMLAHGTLTTPRNIETGTILRFGSGDMSFTFA